VGLKDDMRVLLQTGADARLAELVRSSPRTVRHLVARLWDSDEVVGARAARALGDAALAHPALVREVIRRLMWALNDESGTRGGPGLIGLGEIGRRSPDLIAPYVAALVACKDDRGLLAELLGAFGAIAASAPDLVVPYRSALERAVDGAGPRERAALAALRAVLDGSSDE
jgi:hypothetical protein